jgi:perosamine synthetase
MIKGLICKSNNTLLDVMRIINENAMGICFIVDKLNTLKGVVTDGDIRRALLNDISLNEKINKILSKEFSYGNIDEDYNDLILKLNDKIKIIPLVDNNFKVVDFFEYNQSVHFPVAIPNLNGNEFKYLTDAFLSTWISSSGKYIDKFESEFSSYSDCSFGVAVSNGTVALHAALLALGIGKGDEVIVPDLTFAGTINAVLHANATPVIVDINEYSWCIDPKEIEKSITSKTKAIIPVHLYGQVCDMDNIIDLAKKYNLKVIEDCAEAHGATFKGKKVGSFGDIGCFSFYGNKVITTGEGGMCVTSSAKINESLRLLRDHGMSRTKRYFHEIVGYNYRMTNLQASIGVAQLERIDSIHKNRRVYENIYRSALANKNILFQNNLQNRQRITWLVSVLLDENINRDLFILELKEKGIEARPFFYPLSDMNIYKKYSIKKNLISKKISRLGLNFPTYESLKSGISIKKIMENIL